MNSDFSNVFINLAAPIDEDAEFIPLITDDEEASMEKMNVPDLLPVLLLRNTVLFPGVVIPITIGRDKSVKLIQEVNKKNKLLGAVSQQDSNIDDPKIDGGGPSNRRTLSYCKDKSAGGHYRRTQG